MYNLSMLADINYCTVNFPSFKVKTKTHYKDNDIQ